MPSYLEIAYLASHSWCYPLLSAVQANPSLASKHKAWAAHRLSDLAFAIDGRLRTLPEVVRVIDEHLNALGRSLAGDHDVPNYILGGYAYRFAPAEEAAVRRVLLGTVSFIREARSCFENLADFRAEFLEHYLGTQAGDKKSRYEAIDGIFGKPKWTKDLAQLRHDVSHYRYPWLAFKVRKSRSRRYEPVLVLNWRPGAMGPGDRVPFERLRAIRSGLNAGVNKLMKVLLKRVR